MNDMEKAVGMIIALSSLVQQLSDTFLHVIEQVDINSVEKTRLTQKIRDAQAKVPKWTS